MSTCPRCGHVNQPDAKFCSQCASAMATPPVNVQMGAPPPVNVQMGAPPPVNVQMGAPMNVQAPMGQPMGAQPKAKKPKKILFLLPIFFIAQIGIFIAVFSGNGCTGSVEGQIVSAGEPHGDYTMVPTSCFSGEHESFFGVWVTPDLIKIDGDQGFQGGLKIVRAHTGEWQVFVESPKECQGLSCKIRQLDTSSCKTFDVNVHNTNTTINDIRVREGHATIDCDTPEGGHYEAKVKFDGCS